METREPKRQVTNVRVVSGDSRSRHLRGEAYLLELECGHQIRRTYSQGMPKSCGIFKDAVRSILATIAKQERIRISRMGSRRSGEIAQAKPHRRPSAASCEACEDHAARRRSLTMLEDFSGAGSFTGQRSSDSESASPRAWRSDSGLKCHGAGSVSLEAVANSNLFGSPGFCLRSFVLDLCGFGPRGSTAYAQPWPSRMPVL
jgi:hypothetical protein